MLTVSPVVATYPVMPTLTGNLPWLPLEPPFLVEAGAGFKRIEAGSVSSERLRSVWSASNTRLNVDWDPSWTVKRKYQIHLLTRVYIHRLTMEVKMR